MTKINRTNGTNAAKKAEQIQKPKKTNKTKSSIFVKKNTTPKSTKADLDKNTKHAEADEKAAMNPQRKERKN